MEKHAAAVIAYTRDLIRRFGPRGPGSEASLNCADALANDARGFADIVETQDFTLSPKAFLAWIRLLVAAYVIAVAGLWLEWYLVSALVLILAVGILVLQFFLYKEVLDPFYPKATGRNVLASIEPEGDVKGELMISGHHDSAQIFNFLVFQPGLYGLRVTGSISSLLALTAYSFVAAVLELIGVTLVWAWIPTMTFTTLLLLVLQLWFFASKRHTEGAGDNLASSALAWEYLKLASQAKKEGRGLKHLRVTAVSWDAEEAGLRGSRAWRKARKADPLKHKVWNYNIECLFSESDLFFLTSDINGSQVLSDDLAKRCSRLLKEKAGVESECRPIAFLTGGTDAGETARAGVEATTLMGMPWANDARSSVYHTPKDTADAVSEKAVEKSLVLAAALAEELDGELSVS